MINARPAAGLRALWRCSLAGLVVLLMVVGSAVSAHADTTYRVQSGDTLSGIAARYGTTVEAIMAANSLPSRSTIYAGQVLTIPSSASSGTGSAPAQPKPGPGGSAYIVQSGDTLSGIASRYGITVDAIRRANNLASSTIFAGQQLVIPSGSSAPQPAPPQQPAPTQQPKQPEPQQTQPQAGSGTYTVQSGDSFYWIAKKLGVSAQALAAANGKRLTDILYAGEVLKVPGANQQQPPTQATQPPAQPPGTTTALPTSQPTTTPQPVSSEQTAQPGKPVQYTVRGGDSLSSIAAKFNTTVDALVTLNKLPNRNFLRVGQVLTVVAGDDQDNNPPDVTPAPEPTQPMGKFGPKWVDVNITTQSMVAFEGQTPVFSSKISSGVPRHPTVLGTYRVYAKYRYTLMQGGQGTPEYYRIPNVPYTLYFYSGYALHGAYWHNNFGHPMSHGCVNLPLDAAKWMYEWAPIGTMVVTHR